MLRVATFNINGIRAAHRRGFAGWLTARECDVVTLQEVRCPLDALPENAFGEYVAVYDAGRVPGRNGVAVLTRRTPAAIRSWGTAPAAVVIGTSSPRDATVATEPSAPEPLARELRPFADQGRYVEVDLADTPLTVASLYLPKGGLPAHLQKPGRMREAPDGGAKHLRKLSFMRGFARQVERSRRRARAAGREYLLTGDFNIAHTPLDVNSWRQQVNNEGFLPVEREWLDELVAPRRLHDVVRRHHGEHQGPYSWWSWMGNAFANDTGWRIDYHLATPALARAAVTAVTDRDPSPSSRISDHAPVVVDYDLTHTQSSSDEVSPSLGPVGEL